MVEEYNLSGIPNKDKWLQLGGIKNIEPPDRA